MAEVNTNQPTLICPGCNQLKRKADMMNLEFGKLCSWLCWDCIVSINSNATKDENQKVRKDNKRLIEILKEHTKHYNSINYETLVLLCNYTYEGIIK